MESIEQQTAASGRVINICFFRGEWVPEVRHRPGRAEHFSRPAIRIVPPPKWDDELTIRRQVLIADGDQLIGRGNYIARNRLRTGSIDDFVPCSPEAAGGERAKFLGKPTGNGEPRWNRTINPQIKRTDGACPPAPTRCFHVAAAGGSLVVRPPVSARDRPLVCQLVCHVVG